MSVELIKYAFIAGELSPTLYGRTDLTKYDLGMAQTKNWFVDYRGGLSSRPGFEFIDYVKHDDKATRFFSFRFSPDLSNTYVVLFGHNYVRFIQDGGYVLSAPLTVTGVSQAAPGVVTAPAHGLTDGRWVKFSGIVGMTELNGRTYEIADVTTNTFTLIDPGTRVPVDTTNYTAYVSGGAASPVYELVSPYGDADLAELSAFQIRDTLRLTHPDFPIKNLTRRDHADWIITNEVIGNPYAAPTGLQLTASASGSASVVYAVAAIMPDGTEGLVSRPARAASIVNFASTAGSVRVTWNSVPGATGYIVYRSHIVAQGTGASAGSQLGFLARVQGTFMVDSNIIPDFTKGPYQHYNPFAPGAIDEITVTAGGTGYTFIANVSVSGAGGSGSGFSGYAIVDEDGSITDVVIRNRGSGYVAPVTVTISSGGGGSGATATATVTPTTGLYPSISSLFQQRQVYAASRSFPLNIWASQIRRYGNFDSGEGVIDSDSYEFEVDSAEVTPLLHLLSMRGGLLIMSQTGIWLLTGGTQGPVTPTNALADPQVYTGISAVQPLKIGPDLLYVEGKGYSVRLLSYNDFSKVYSGEDKSILANHLFGPDRQIVRWAFAENPYKVVWGIRSDGAIIAFTVVKEQDVFAWTWGETKGLFRDIIAIEESGWDRCYVMVERLIGGRMRKYLERMAVRDFDNIEDAWAVDSGLRASPPPAASTLNISAEFPEGDRNYVMLTASAPTFTGTLNWTARAAGGIFDIVDVVSPTEAKALVRFSATNLLPEDPQLRVLPAAPGEWTFGPASATYSGLWHLEGEEVSILADGNVFPRQVVTNGRVTLPENVTKILVGLPYECIGQTLPPVVTDLPIEARRKRVVGIAVRLHESRGLLIGRTLSSDDLYPLRERTNEAYGAPIVPVNGYKYQILHTDWDEDSQTYFVQRDPLPVTILGLLPDIEVGDDTN